MRVLLTGANGFIGTYLRKHLSREHSVIAIARNGCAEDTESLDLLDCDAIDRFVDMHKHDSIDVIVHAAGVLANSNMSYMDQLSVFFDNIRISNSIIELVNSQNIKTLVNLSSFAVYPNEDGEYNENSETRTSSNSDCFYGLSKLVSENMFDYALGEKVRRVHFRISQVYGAGMREDRIIPQMINSIKMNNTIEVFGNGERISNFISVEKVCEAVKTAVEDQKLFGIYNLGGESITYYRLAERIRMQYGNSNTRIIKVSSGPQTKFIFNTDKWDTYQRERNGKSHEIL